MGCCDVQCVGSVEILHWGGQLGAQLPSKSTSEAPLFIAGTGSGATSLLQMLLCWSGIGVSI